MLMSDQAKVVGMSEELELTGVRYNVALLLFFPAYFLYSPDNKLLLILIILSVLI